MTSKAKAKGNSAEREICAILGDFLGGTWLRVPNSGAFLGGANHFRQQSLDQSQISKLKGDIIPPQEWSRLVIESKFYKDFQFNRLLVNEPIPQLDSWLEQNLSITTGNEIPLLIMKFNRKGMFIAIKESDSNGFELNNYARYKYKGEYFIITEFVNFLEQNKTQLIKFRN